MSEPRTSSAPHLKGGLDFAAAGIEHIGAVMDYVVGTCERAEMPADAVFAVRLAVEEVFTNIIRHGYGGRHGPVKLDLEVADGVATATLADEAPLFDPSTAPRPNLDAGPDDRPEGGLGWHLVRQLMDEVRHQPRQPTGNTVTLTKRLPNSTTDRCCP